MQCDCEYEHAEQTCGHRPGACSNQPIVKVSLYGLSMNICQHCLDATCNDDIFPLFQKLRANYHVLANVKNSAVYRVWFAYPDDPHHFYYENVNAHDGSIKTAIECCLHQPCNDDQSCMPFAVLAELADLHDALPCYAAGIGSQITAYYARQDWQSI